MDEKQSGIVAFDCINEKLQTNRNGCVNLLTQQGISKKNVIDFFSGTFVQYGKGGNVIFCVAEQSVEFIGWCMRTMQCCTNLLVMNKVTATKFCRDIRTIFILMNGNDTGNRKNFLLTGFSGIVAVHAFQLPVLAGSNRFAAKC